jgi:hypothetical protein
MNQVFSRISYESLIVGQYSVSLLVGNQSSIEPFTFAKSSQSPPFVADIELSPFQNQDFILVQLDGNSTIDKANALKYYLSFDSEFKGSVFDYTESTARTSKIVIPGPVSDPLGRFYYKPALNFNGKEQLSYYAVDLVNPFVKSIPASIFFKVLFANQPPYFKQSH